MDYYKLLLTETITTIKQTPSYKQNSAYNIFNVLQVDTKEVIMCRFLADLLNSQGQHNYHILFLKSFLQDVLLQKDINDTLLFHTNVYTEYKIDLERRIDIVIQNTKFFIPIEVKIWAEEQEGQCYDYYKYAQNSPMIYLTIPGDMPSEYSRRSKETMELLATDNIHCISWKHDIAQWLSKLLDKLQDPIKSIVMQYIDAIHMFTDERETTLMEKQLNTLYQSPEYFEAGLSIEKTMKTAKVHLMKLVFDEFFKAFEKIAIKYDLELETERNYYHYEKQCNPKFYETTGSTSPGLNYIYKKAAFQNKNLQLWFRIEIYEQFYAGFILFDTEADSKDDKKGYEVLEITNDMLEQAAKYINKDIFCPTACWLTWCYPNGISQDGYYDDVPDFKHMNPYAISLVDEENRKSFIENAISVFEEQLLKHLILIDDL